MLYLFVIVRYSEEPYEGGRFGSVFRISQYYVHWHAFAHIYCCFVYVVVVYAFDAMTRMFFR